MKQRVAGRIRKLRLSRGLSQQNMADELSLSPAAYSNIERGVADVNMSRLQQIAEVLKVGVVDLLSDELPPIASETMDAYQMSFHQQLNIMMKQLQLFQNQIESLQREVADLKKPKRK